MPVPRDQVLDLLPQSQVLDRLGEHLGAGCEAVVVRLAEPINRLLAQTPAVRELFRPATECRLAVDQGVV